MERTWTVTIRDLRTYEPVGKPVKTKADDKLKAIARVRGICPGYAYHAKAA